MLHNICLCSFPGLTDQCVMNKDMLYESSFLSDLYCFQGKSLGGDSSSQNAELDDRIHGPRAFPCVYIVNIFDFIKLFIH